MPGIYKPIITNYPLGAVSIRTMDAPPSYNTLQSSLGYTLYKLFKLYIKTNNIGQLSQNLLFSKYDVTGLISKEVITIAIDPYQIQSALNLDLKRKNIILDGNWYYFLPLLPLQTVIMIFDVYEFSTTDLLPKIGMFYENAMFQEFKTKL